MTATDRFTSLLGRARGAEDRPSDVWASVSVVSVDGVPLQFRFRGTPGGGHADIVWEPAAYTGRAEQVVATISVRELADWHENDFYLARPRRTRIWWRTMQSVAMFARTAREGDHSSIYSHTSYTPPLTFETAADAPQARWPVAAHIRMADGELGMVASTPDEQGDVIVSFATSFGHPDRDPVRAAQDTLTLTSERRRDSRVTW